MLSILKTLFKKVIPQWALFQRFYLGLYYVGLWGMNYGRTSDLKGSGELNALKILKAKLVENTTILDVGANVGDYSLLLAKFFPKAKIHAFEPVKNTFDLLIKNTENYSNITPHNLGFGDLDQEAEIFFSHNNSHSSMVGHRNTEDTDKFTEIIQVKRLDDFVRAQRIEQIDFLKIDVEGFEINVLRGAEELLKTKKIQCIQFEFGGTMIDAHVFLKDFYDLLNDNYNLYRITKNGLFPIGEYKPHFEIFHYCNYMAILKS